MDNVPSQDFPDINRAFLGASETYEVCSNFIELLNATGNIQDILYANKLLEYLEINKMIPALSDEFHEFKNHLREWTKTNGLKLFVLRRKKDFIGFNAKIRLFLLNGKNPNDIHDLIGFRIVLLTPKKDTPETVKLCYEVLNEAIRFFAIKRKCLFLDAEPILEPGNIEELEDIIIPSESNLILPGFENKVKDYIKEPKRNGYQSLHCCIKTPSQLIFEIQIRTYEMDNRAEFGSSMHKNHKSERYEGVNIDLDYSKINLRGICFDNGGNLVSDLSGLLKSIDPFNLI